MTLSPRRPLSLADTDWPANKRIVPSLDGLRAASITIVLAGHMILPAALVGVSALGLTIFFFISGFLITRLMFAELRETGGLSLPNFFIRRVLRLYPVLVVYMLCVIVVMIAKGQRPPPIEALSVSFYFYNFLLAHNELLNIDTIMPIGVLWSLSVEEQFYLFAPVTLVFLRFSPISMLRVALAVCVASLTLRYLYVVLWPGIENTLWIYRHSETRADSIAFGVVLATLCEWEGGRRLIKALSTRPAFATSVLVLLATYAVRDNYFQNTIRFTIQSVALVPIVCGVVFAQPFPWINRGLNLASVRWVGRLSYSLYIWHGGTTFFFGSIFSRMPAPLAVIVDLVVTFLMAVASYYIVERPALRWRRAFNKTTAVVPTIGGVP